MWSCLSKPTNGVSHDIWLPHYKAEMHSMESATKKPLWFTIVAIAIAACLVDQAYIAHCAEKLINNSQL